MNMLIVGLGNPGKKYKKTRHDVGYRVIDELESLRQAQGEPANFILLKTGTFMNQSGGAVKKLIKNYKLEIKNLIVIHDDVDIPVGEFKIQKGRGAAGHKGAQSIIDALKTKDFWRVRIGICPPRGKPENVEKFVLQNFTKEEEKTIKNLTPEVFREIEKINK